MQFRLVMMLSVELKMCQLYAINALIENLRSCIRYCCNLCLPACSLINNSLKALVTSLTDP